MQADTSSDSTQTKAGKYTKRLSNEETAGFHSSFRIDEDFFRNVIESIEDYAIFTTDIEGVISSWSKGASRLFGYSEKEMIGKDAKILFDSADIRHGIPKRQMASALKKGRAKDERWHLGRNGKKIWTSGLLFALKDDTDKVRGFAKILRDMTGSKEFDQHKDDFIGIAAHELKTPVTSVKAYAQVLEHRFTKEGDEKSAELLRKMDTQLDRLTSLIGDLLDITRIEANRFQLNYDNFDFDTFIEEFVTDFQRTSVRHKLVIKGNAKRNITIDQDRLKQVIGNIITNAIKYSPHADEIILHVSSDENSVKLCVQDKGIGLSPDVKHKVFQRFYRVSGPNQKSYPGLGVGLYVSSEIIKRLGGKIWVESAPGEGSTFCIVVPGEPKIKAKHIEKRAEVLAEEAIKHE